jgi:hypothetical protein
MASNPILSLKDTIAPRQQRDLLGDSHRELLDLIERHYERTGDLSLKEIIDRAKAIGRR